MDKSWIQQSRASNAYLEGIGRFLEYAFANSACDGKIKCPCIKCNNCYWQKRENVYEHCVSNGFIRNYTPWIFHGEAASSTSRSAFENLAGGETVPHRDNMHEPIPNLAVGAGDIPYESNEGLNGEAEKFLKVSRDAEQELYPSCKSHTKLSLLDRLYDIKCSNGWSNDAFTMVLELLKDALPGCEMLPESLQEMKKFTGNKRDREELRSKPDCRRIHMAQMRWKRKQGQELGAPRKLKKVKGQQVVDVSKE